ncbi:hypothetical protein BH18ACI4_BH18ACI4_20000 [soil metagenome]
MHDIRKEKGDRPEREASQTESSGPGLTAPPSISLPKGAFTWYPSLAEQGFGRCQRVRKALDEEQGPRLVFANGTRSIYLADMSGDGLNDLLRIRNSEVCFWPDLGYGCFGRKLTRGFDNKAGADKRGAALASVSVSSPV